MGIASQTFWDEQFAQLRQTKINNASKMIASPWYLLSEKQPAPNQWCEYKHHSHSSAGIYSDYHWGFWELGKGTFIGDPSSTFWRPLDE
jgi:hypothetical protein